MKKLLSLFVALLLLLTFVGCGNDTSYDFEAKFNAIFSDIDASNVTKDLDLPTSIATLKISWTSSNEEALTNSGVITNVTGEDVVVTLTAHMTYEKESKDLSKELTIKSISVTSINDILDGELAKYDTAGTVVAKNAQSFLISDGNAQILVFQGSSWTNDLAIGDYVIVSGTTTAYPNKGFGGDAKQFGSDCTYRKMGTKEVNYGTAKELTATDINNYGSQKNIKPEYVKLTGNLIVKDDKYFNIKINGSSIKGSLLYPIDSESLKELDGKDVEVYGYVVYGTGSTSVNFLNIMFTSCKAVESSVIVPTDTKTVKEALEGESGNSYKVSGVVAAKNARSFILKDETGMILVYLGVEPTVSKGDKVVVTGTTSVYGKAVQFGNDSQVEKLGTETVTEPVAKELTAADADAYGSLETVKIEYVKVKGTLTVSGYYYNLAIDGATIIGSISYPLNTTELGAYNGKEIEVIGYVTGTASENKYLNILACEVKLDEVIEDNPVVTPTGNSSVLDFSTKAASHSYYTDAWQYGNFTISGGANNNGAWDYVKIGGKKANMEKYSDYYIKSDVATTSETKKVTVYTNAGNLSKAGKVKSWTLKVYSDAECTQEVASIAGAEMTKGTAQELVFNAESTWQAGCYFKIVFELENTTSDNGIVWINKVVIE